MNLPTEFCVVKYGTSTTKFEDGEQEISFTKEDAEQLLKTFTICPIDYEFETISNGSGKPAGFVNELEMREDGLYAIKVTWVTETPIGDYKTIAPAFEYDDNGELVRVVCMAFTNFPAVNYGDL